MALRLNPVFLGIITSLMLPATASANSIEQAFADGKADIDIRVRYETVDDGTNEDADAITMRTRLGFTTATTNNIQAHVDFEVVNTGGDFNSTKNGLGTHAVVVDPSVEELNQAWLSYTGIANNTLKFGRQRVILDNARFVGNVGWRQNEQTFDALAFINNSFDDVTILFANVQQVNNIKGDAINTNTNLLNVGIDKTPVGKVSAYAYSIDLNGSSANDTLTIGARLKGNVDEIMYTAEFAQQSDTADNTADVSTTYTNLEIGYKMGDTQFFIADEILGSDDGAVGFQTILATGHAFNGWADKFLTTPAAGLNDLSLKVVTKVAGLKVVGVYHDFSADDGNADYGTEIDLLVVKPINKNLKALVKFSDYNADDFSTDTQKIWLALEGNFSQ